jgi:hypothetical protein
MTTIVNHKKNLKSMFNHFTALSLARLCGAIKSRFGIDLALPTLLRITTLAKLDAVLAGGRVVDNIERSVEVCTSGCWLVEMLIVVVVVERG